jgi:hypothetical protein
MFKVKILIKFDTNIFECNKVHPFTTFKVGMSNLIKVLTLIISIRKQMSVFLMN